jgi:solute carrier family 25 phosphate transporter 23/24/25/41
MDSVVLVEPLPLDDYQQPPPPPPPQQQQQQHAPDAADSAAAACWTVAGFFAPALTSVPGSGYFLAGGMAGVVSRTATAPLDRLKVYLIAQTSAAAAASSSASSSSASSASSSVRQALGAAAANARHGAPLAAANAASRPLLEACRALWRAGGVRSLFAGESVFHFPSSSLSSLFLPGETY